MLKNLLLTYVTLLTITPVLIYIYKHVENWAVNGKTEIWVGKKEGKRPLGRRRCRWVDNITTDLQEVGCGFMNWIGLTQDREWWRTLVSAVMNFRVP
jgi:hypothetical protein